MIKAFSHLIKVIKNHIDVKATRGYIDLQKTNSDLINQIKNQLADHPLENKKTSIQNIILPKNHSIELSLHQFLLSKLVGDNFTRVALYFIRVKRKLIYPLPRPWLKIIENSGIEVSYFWSSCLFYLYILISWLNGLLKTFKHIFNNPKRSKKNQKHAYFFNLGRKCFPSSRNKDTEDIMSWYVNQYDNDKGNKEKLIFHSTPDVDNFELDSYHIAYNIDCFPKLSFVNFYFKFLPTTFFSILVATLSFNWKNIVLLSEIVDMLAFKFADNKQLADKYFFSYSHITYRPLWTYTEKLKVNSLIFYFYACNISTYQEGDKKYSTVPEFFQVMNWPKYLVWNNTYLNYIKNEFKFPSEIEIVGPIGHEDSTMDIPKNNKLSLLAFDIQPYRPGFGIPALSCAQWYAHDYSVPVDFLRDLQEVCLELGIELFFKRKRDSILTHKRYLNFIKNFIKYDNVVEVDSGISASRLCKQFDLVISMPFTSTGVLADNLGKDSIYYDPKSTIQKNDRAAHNLEVINGKNELRNYLKIFIESNNI